MNEERLIERASQGDTQAFDQLLSEHEKRMYGICLRMCRNQEDAQDCLQESMLRIFRAITSFKGQSSFSTWVYRITMNACIDELRRRKNAQQVSVDTLMEEGWMPVDPGETPEEHAVSVDQQAELSRLIRQLPEDMRAAVVLRDIQGYTYEEISEILDTNVGTVKSRISRGRERLREKILKKRELF